MKNEWIQESHGVLVRIASWITKKKFGKVITPIKVIYSKKPDLLLLGDKISKYEDKKIRLPEDLKFLIKSYCSTLNGCGFCQDLAMAQVVRQRLGERKFAHLSNWENSEDGIYTNRDQAVLHFIKEYARDKAASNEAIKELHSHFTAQEVVDIVTMNAIENFYNALNIPYGIESDHLADLARKRLIGGRVIN